MPRILILLLLLVASLLVATAVPGAFTIDENHYLASVRAMLAGRVTVPGTEGLRPSIEYYAFDPHPEVRGKPELPLAPHVPPLYAPIAAPFSAFGWYGLIALNALSFAAAIALVFVYAKTQSLQKHTPWVAASALLFGSFCIEYAQGMWPHALSMALCTGAAFLAARARREGALVAALFSGLLLGWATGVRYQNIVLAGGVGLGLFLFSDRQRFRASAAFLLGLAVPLVVSAFINHSRAGIWNPISKGSSYARLGVFRQEGSNKLFGFAHALYAKVVDFSTQTPIQTGPRRYSLIPDPVLGVFMQEGAVKKALLQSAPWLTLALLILVAAWFRKIEQPAVQKRELKAMSLVFAAVLTLFGLAGVARHDGLCFNQRYFLELMPLGAVAFAWALDGVRLSRKHVLTGLAIGLVAGGIALVRPSGAMLRAVGLSQFPLVFAGALAVVWLLVKRNLLAPSLLQVAAAAGLAWALAAHLGDDLPASRRRREANLQLAQRWDAVLSDRAALYVFWDKRDATAPVHLGRDLLVIDANSDDGADVSNTLADVLRQGRRVFADTEVLPLHVLRKLTAENPFQVVGDSRPDILEILPSAKAASPQVTGP